MLMDGDSLPTLDSLPLPLLEESPWKKLLLEEIVG